MRRAGADEALAAYMIDSRSAEQSAAGKETLQNLVRALAGLPEAVREVIWLGRFEFSRYDDLGKALGCNPGAARVRMHRAMKQLNETFTTINGAPIDV